jgi:hypothetical protein
MNLKPKPTGNASPTPEEALTNITKRIMAAAQGLRALQAELAGAQAAFRDERGAFATMPQSYAEPLWTALDRCDFLWAAHRFDLTGGPAPRSRAAENVSEQRARVTNAEERLAYYQNLLDKSAGGRGEGRAELRRLAEGWAQTLRQERKALADALRLRGNLTREELREVLALTEAASEPVVVSIAM